MKMFLMKIVIKHFNIFCFIFFLIIWTDIFKKWKKVERKTDWGRERQTNVEKIIQPDGQPDTPPNRQTPETATPPHPPRSVAEFCV